MKLNDEANKLHWKIFFKVTPDQMSKALRYYHQLRAETSCTHVNNLWRLKTDPSEVKKD